MATVAAQPDYRQLVASIRETVDEVIRPNAERIDREGVFPSENLQALADKGWNSLIIPTDYDGLGLDYTAFALAAEEIGKGCPSTSLIYVMHVGAAQTLVYYGTEDQKQRWLKSVRRGAIGTHSMSEKATGGHTWFNLSEAKRDGEDYILDLEKSFTTSGGHADFYVLQTRTPGAQQPTDLSYFIVDGKDPGITAGPWEALGVRGNQSGPLKLENVHVPRADLLVGENRAIEIAFNGVDPLYLLGIGSAWIGVASEALSIVVERVKRTVHRDFNRSLADYQVIRQQLANAKIGLSALKPWQLSLAEKYNRYEAEGRPLGELWYEATEFKIHATEVANQVVSVAMDVTGGYGYKKGTIERLYRDVRAGLVLAPSNHLARELVGKELVGQPPELFTQGGE
ncbi:acyl-CoA dehydrogenase [Paenibacillus glycanilyticus]|uniref:Acyl-CoA dehydrogenase n=1 Tax=Paenibacillus glycanilyticus TaxID=126569 RepID=A0ABQ6NIS7_9BACL|nr:acyl-CoA dehydrogenase family protein [Paenibacillus glycanilyticus]GMK45016.1 acyl-CoA dehydrogenase [Paenibacillus glycanilyticus]